MKANALITDSAVLVVEGNPNMGLIFTYRKDGQDVSEGVHLGRVTAEALTAIFSLFEVMRWEDIKGKFATIEYDEQGITSFTDILGTKDPLTLLRMETPNDEIPPSSTGDE